MKLTPFAKLFITVVILGVVGYAFWHYKGGDVRQWAVGRSDSAAPADASVSSSDFDALKNAPPDPKRGSGNEGVTQTALAGAGKLGRPLVVAINTWAGHAPGIVANGGLDATAQSAYAKRYGLNVKFVLIEDPAAKLAAFRKGDVDVMWNTVDNWAREASSPSDSPTRRSRRGRRRPVGADERSSAPRRMPLCAPSLPGLAERRSSGSR